MKELGDRPRNAIGIAVSTMNGAVLQNDSLLQQIEELAWPTLIVNQYDREDGRLQTGFETHFGVHVIIDDSDGRGL